MTNEDILKRLAYIKYLYKAGVEQSKQPEVIAYTSVLSFHDSIDWFMNLACLKRGISEKDKRTITGKPNTYLMDYFTILQDLTLSASVEKINTRRNNLKHSFQIPAQFEIEECKGIATLFFEENTKLIFGMGFSEISLFNLISFPEIKKKVEEADKLIKENDVTNGVNQIALAFNNLLKIDHLFKINNYGNNLFVREWGMRPIKGASHRSNSIIKESIEPLVDNINDLKKLYDKNFSAINESLRIFSLGIDYRKYTKFRFLSPVIIKIDSRDVSFLKMNADYDLTKDDIQFLFDFTIECSLKIQEFEYN